MHSVHLFVFIFFFNRLIDRFEYVRNIIEELKSVCCPIKVSNLFGFGEASLMRRVCCSYSFAPKVFEKITRYHFLSNTFAQNVSIDDCQNR